MGLKKNWNWKTKYGHKKTWGRKNTGHGITGLTLLTSRITAGKWNNKKRPAEAQQLQWTYSHAALEEINWNKRRHWILQDPSKGWLNSSKTALPSSLITAVWLFAFIHLQKYLRIKSFRKVTFWTFHLKSPLWLLVFPLIEHLILFIFSRMKQINSNNLTQLLLN